jgi:phospholipid/cholesterol/gamma-HCH transport system substrate-binding protein
MKKENARNIAVGLTVLGGLAAFGALLLVFAKLPERFRGGYTLNVRMDSTSGVREGDFVHFSGINVGRVTAVGFADPRNPGRGVIITNRIDSHIRLPGNINYYVHRGLMGNTFIEILADGPQRTDPRTGRPVEYVPADEPFQIDGTVKSYDPMARIQPALETITDLADDLAPALRSVGELARNVNRLLDPGDEDANAPPAGQEQGLRGTVARLNGALDGVNALLGDANSRRDIRMAFRGLADASGRMSRAMTALEAASLEANDTLSEAGRTLTDLRQTSADARSHLREISMKVIDSAERASDILASIHRVSRKVDDGQGTAGRLINDPSLYENLEQVTTQMEMLLKEARQTVTLWKAEGLRLKLD